MSAKDVDDVLERAAEFARSNVHSLDTFTRTADEHLDAAHESQRRLAEGIQGIIEHVAHDDAFMVDGIVAPLGEWSTAHAREVRHAAKRDPSARYADELEALRAFYSARYVSRSGATERLRGMLLLGTTPTGSSRVVEPHIDPHAYAVARALRALPGDGAELLRLTFVEVVPPRNRTRNDKDGNVLEVLGVDAGRSAVTIAAACRRGDGNLPPWSNADAATVTPAYLVAERLLISTEPDAVRALQRRITLTRRVLRVALQAVVLRDTTPPRVLPEVIASERTAGRPAVDVECCSGTVQRAGLREPCRVVRVRTATSAAWLPCAYCGRPTVPRRGVAPSAR